VVCMLGGKFPPFFKWLLKASSEDSELGEIISKHIQEIVSLDQERFGSKCMLLIEEICTLIVDRLHIMGLSERSDNYLLSQAIEIVSHIQDEKLRNMSIWIEKG
jgi:hypothetical protein